jgi:hypothetical protein
MIATLSVAGKDLYSVEHAVPTGGIQIAQAQAKLRYFVYYIVPERVYEWVAKWDHQFASIR